MKPLKKLSEDFMKSPMTIKICMAILAIGVGLMVFSCASGASKDFIVQVDNQSSVYLDWLSKFIEKATPEELEIALNKVPGTFKGNSDEDIRLLKNSLILDINSFLFMVKENRKLLEEKKQ